jgi:hypothetical protein
LPSAACHQLPPAARPSADWWQRSKLDHRQLDRLHDRAVICGLKPEQHRGLIANFDMYGADFVA